MAGVSGVVSGLALAAVAGELAVLVDCPDEKLFDSCGDSTMARASKPIRKARRPGPKPETLKLEGNWERAVKKSLSKKKPANGWPK